MNKKVLIGIIVAILVIIAIVAGVVISNNIIQKIMNYQL